jgi:hypothetical protein
MTAGTSQPAILIANALPALGAAVRNRSPGRIFGCLFRPTVG